MSLDQQISEHESRRRKVRPVVRKTDKPKCEPVNPWADHALNFLSDLNRKLAAQYQKQHGRTN